MISAPACRAAAAAAAHGRTVCRLIRFFRGPR